MSNPKFNKTHYAWLVEALSKPLTDECMIWPFPNLHPVTGHGQVYVPGKQGAKLVHRVAFLLHYGHWPTPVGMHTCDVARCFNPLHIKESTQAENAQDMDYRGRRANGRFTPPLETIAPAIPYKTKTLYQWVLEQIADHSGEACLIWPFGVTSVGRASVLMPNGKRVQVHRLAFFLKHGRWPKPCALHSCDDGRCFHWAHLREGTQQENIKDMMDKGRHVALRGEQQGNRKLTEAAVREIRRLYASGHYSHPKLGRMFDVSHSTIGRIVRNEIWGHVP